jgi:uncharacterized protein YaaR (DUF327 family)
VEVSELDDARKDLEKAYQKVREDLGEVHVAFEAVMAAGPEDDIHDLLKTLQDEVKEARDGGLLKSGANDHKRALKKYRDLQP